MAEKSKILFIFLIIPGFTLFTYQVLFVRKIYPQVKIAGIDVSGKSMTSALRLLGDGIEGQDKSIVFTFDNNEWVANLDSFDLVYSPQASVNRAYTQARSDNLFQNIKKHIITN